MAALLTRFDLSAMGRLRLDLHTPAMVVRSTGAWRRRHTPRPRTAPRRSTSPRRAVLRVLSRRRTSSPRACPRTPSPSRDSAPAISSRTPMPLLREGQGALCAAQVSRGVPSSSPKKCASPLPAPELSK
ncbi:hypothetical protein PVAP13_7NG069817 [Panicum virgatum]|uniref:Uncharacterized protein n=1 Tax=Panicum virgatum TaxID=38727 RepID=A0A8T0PZZ4_PANVG|nr:hypothetical protein PVAP13_7NG069817 [Panicum virgatum]